MTIKHLVLSGGSWKGLYVGGAIQKLLDDEYFKLSEIETIWATSVGTIIGTLLCLKIEWNDILNYFTNLPLHSYQSLNWETYINAINSCGLFNKDFFVALLSSLFKAKDLDITSLTLKEYYEYSNVEMHFFAVNYHSLKTVDFNYKNNPDLRLLDALYSSCTLPFAFQPKEIEGQIYIDGGVNVHYPAEYCYKCKKNDEILGIYIKTSDKCKDNLKNLLEFGISLMHKIVFYKQEKQLNLLNNQLIITAQSLNFNDVMDLIKNKEKRRKIIDAGRDFAFIFLKMKSNNS